MHINAVGWPAKGPHKSTLNGLSKLELRAENHEQALLLLSVYRIFDSGDKMDELDKLILGMTMQQRGIKPVDFSDKVTKEFDRLYKELREKFEPPPPSRRK